MTWLTKKLDNCLACNSKRLKLILDLGDQPLANSYLSNPLAIDPSYPLALNVCENCFHCQLTHVVNPDLMFKDYAYVSGTSTTLKDYFEWFAQFAIQQHSEWNNGDRPNNVLDIACNDGTQLDIFQKYLGNETYGIDPASNLFTQSSKKHTVICDYLCAESITELCSLSTYPQFDIINAQNVFAHNADPLDFLKKCRNILSDNGYLYIQNSQTHMIKNGEFDTMYHEHLSFWNASSMKSVAERAGFVLVDRIRTPIHGISDLFILRKSAYLYADFRIENILNMEKYEGLHDIKTYDDFGYKARNILEEFDHWFVDFEHRFADHLFVGYGAAAKGNTFLNAGKFKLDYIIDENPLKIGTYSPGMHIPIVNDDILQTNNNIILLPLAWNFKEEILRKFKAKRPSGKNDYCLTYFPKVGYEKL